MGAGGEEVQPGFRAKCVGEHNEQYWRKMFVPNINASTVTQIVSIELIDLDVILFCGTLILKVELCTQNLGFDFC